MNLENPKPLGCPKKIMKEVNSRRSQTIRWISETVHVPSDCLRVNNISLLMIRPFSEMHLDLSINNSKSLQMEEWNMLLNNKVVSRELIFLILYNLRTMKKRAKTSPVLPTNRKMNFFSPFSNPQIVILAIIRQILLVIIILLWTCSHQMLWMLSTPRLTSI